VLCARRLPTDGVDALKVHGRVAVVQLEVVQHNHHRHDEREHHALRDGDLRHGNSAISAIKRQIEIET